MTIIYLTKQHHTLIVPQSSLFPLLLMGLLTGVGMLVGWQGLAILDPTFVAFLKRFEPVLVILLSLFYLKERLFVGEIVSIILIAFGGVWSAFGRWEVIGEGVILIMFASLATALQLFIAKTNIQNVSPLILVFYRMSIATCAIALWTIFSGGVNFNIESRYWGVTLLGAFLGPCLSFLCTFNSYRYWELSRSTIVLMLQPLFALVLAVVFLQQFPTSQELMGGIIILIGSVSFVWQYFLQKTS
ncbi:putative membrane protein [Dactylococcopsis salina PCC 8305]|uniref:Membrane protein n=2 Tax=Dactylococcopsis salina TaxID=292566 RepID=K9YQ96_DACS8|nr:putative membrane protein [Dactylococcopsis salina PCC 8305]